MHEQEIPNSTAQIIRDKLTKEAKIVIEYDTEWSLYAGSSIKNINLEKPILKGKGKGVFDLKVNPTHRSYFCLVTNEGKSILAENHLPMAGGYNYRDLGGIKTKDGRHIKWGKIFRADEMSNLLSEDLAYLASIPIRSVIDFRAPSEVKRSPDKLPNTVRFSYPIAITPGNLSSEGIQANLLQIDISKHMKQMNRLLVSDPNCIKALRTVFTILQNSLSSPLIMHCTAGKDRTGMAVALILYALGVDQETIMNDYLISKVYLEDKYAAFIEKHPRAEAIFTVKKMYLTAGLNQIKRDYESVDKFLVEALKVDLNKLRSMYLI